MEQLNALQSLDQLAPLTATKEHLPTDIINILELLGKADNIPFNQLYSLAEDCEDRYYTKVIKTLTCLLKNTFHDRQLVLVNSARALKFFESHAARQAKLWKVLSKYDCLPDHFHDLKTTLQAEFDLLKEATSKNIENIQEAVQSQQAYTTTLCGHINSLYTKLAQLNRQVQTHCLYPHPQLDVVQLNAPEYVLDIDGQPDLVTDIQSPNAKTVKEDTVPDTANSEQHTALSPNTNRPEPQPSSVVEDTGYPGYHNNEQPRAEHPGDYQPQLEDIPELEDNKENWEEDQFADADLIDHHNTTEESDRIHREYSAHFEEVADQAYSPYHSTTQGLEYQIPEPEYYNSDAHPKQYQRYQNLNIYLPPPPSTEDLYIWYGHRHGTAKHLELHSHRLYREKTRSLESRIAKKCKKNQCLRERRSADI